MKREKKDIICRLLIIVFSLLGNISLLLKMTNTGVSLIGLNKKYNLLSYEVILGLNVTAMIVRCVYYG